MMHGRIAGPVRDVGVGPLAHGPHWEATLADRTTGGRSTVLARGIVNASGPWIGRRLGPGADASADAKHDVRLVKGSHIVVGKLFDHPYPYIFQGADGRVLFAIPFEEDYTLLGTTEVEIEGGPGPVAITPAEVDYICAAANAYFEKPISPGDVVWSYSGIRPLLDDRDRNASEVTRDYVLHLDRDPAPMLSVYGGKITTCRRLAEQAVDMLAGQLGCDRPAWTRDAPLPGGEIPGGDVEGFIVRIAPNGIRGLRKGLARHYVRHYGTEHPHPARRPHRASATSESISEPGSTRRRSSTWSSTNGPAPPRTSCGGAPRRDCACRRTGSAACASGSKAGAALRDAFVRGGGSGALEHRITVFGAITGNPQRHQGQGMRGKGFHEPGPASGSAPIRRNRCAKAGREGYARVPDAAGVPRAKFPISRGPPIDDLRCRRVAPRRRLYAFLRAAGNFPRPNPERCPTRRSGRLRAGFGTGKAARVRRGRRRSTRIPPSGSFLASTTGEPGRVGTRDYSPSKRAQSNRGYRTRLDARYGFFLDYSPNVRLVSHDAMFPIRAMRYRPRAA